MTQEDKELLLVDLCARLPYGVKVNAQYKDGDGWKTEDRKILGLYEDGQVYLDCVYTTIDCIKPYLRPMSSMTEEECDKVEEIIGNDCIFDFMGNGDIVLHKGHFTQKTLSKLYDFYNSIHLDYHTDDEGKTMIEKGLAIEVNKSNNPYKD